MTDADVIIVGGGLVGLMSAYYLHESGLSVTLLEKNKMGQEASWAGGGILSPLYPWHYPDAVNELANYSQQGYADFAKALYWRTDYDPEWLPSGLLLTDIDNDRNTNGAEEAAIQAWHKKYPQPMEVVSGQTLQHIEPALNDPSDQNHTRALWFPQIAQIRNPKLLVALQRDLTTKGVTIKEHCAVDQLVQKNKRVIGVHAAGKTYSADKIVIASGAWSGQIAQQCELTVKPVLGQMIMYKTAPSRLQRIILHDGKYIIPRKDGHIICGSTLEWNGFHKTTTAESRAMLERFAAQQVPFLAELEPIKHWSGLRPGSPNSVPYIGEYQQLKGLYFNTGHYRYGVTMSLGSAKLLRDIIGQQSSFLDASQYALQAKREPTAEFVSE